MEKYYFLFAIALLCILFASIQDIKKREVANWLNFSLLAFALAYRAFYSLIFEDYTFFLYGLLGIGAMFIFAYALYYGRVFAGGDAKLLIALGAVLPYESFFDLISVSLVFLFILFFAGALYGIVYSAGLARKRNKEFVFFFISNIKKYKLLFLFALILAIILNLISISSLNFLISIFVLIIPMLYVYLRAVDSCMIKLIDAKNLREGDWLEKDVKIGNRMISKSVHGLSKNDIDLIRKAKRKVLIKEGIPFVPVFLFSFIFMVFFWKTLEPLIETFSLYLF